MSFLAYNQGLGECFVSHDLVLRSRTYTPNSHIYRYCYLFLTQFGFSFKKSKICNLKKVITRFPTALCPPSFSQYPGSIAELYGPHTPGTNTASRLTWKNLSVQLHWKQKITRVIPNTAHGLSIKHNINKMRYVVYVAQETYKVLCSVVRLFYAVSRQRKVSSQIPAAVIFFILFDIITGAGKVSWQSN